MQKVSKETVSLPSFVKVKKGSAYVCLLKYGISFFFYYTISRKGWDMNNNGSEIFYITELGKWIPSKHFDVITGFSPN